MISEKEIDSWYASTVRYYRDMGFFSQQKDFPVDDLVRFVKSAVARDWDEPFPPKAVEDAQAADMFALMIDKDRVWYGDLERIYRGADAYVETLKEWSTISRGTFVPETMAETWKGDTGPVTIEFTFRGQRQRFTHSGGDFIDMSLLTLINRLIMRSGYAFEACDNLGMPGFLLVLTPSEKARLISERKWRFVKLPP